MTKEKKEKITIRVTPNQMLVLEELSEATNSSISMLVRSIILDFIQRNEDRLEEIITNYKNNKINGYEE